MLRVILFTLIVLSFGCEASERVSFYKLVNSPENYIGKQVHLTGYIILLGENCLLISNSKETVIMYREYEMLTVCKSDFSNEIEDNAFAKFDEHYGSVVGYFEIEKCRENLMLGSNLRYLGCLKNITHLIGPIYESGPRMPPPPIN